MILKSHSDIHTITCASIRKKVLLSSNDSALLNLLNLSRFIHCSVIKVLIESCSIYELGSTCELCSLFAVVILTDSLLSISASNLFVNNFFYFLSFAYFPFALLAVSLYILTPIFWIVNTLFCNFQKKVFCRNLY